MTNRVYALLAILLLVAGIGAWLYHKGGEGEDAAKAEIKAVAQSNETSRKTQERVEQQGAQTRRQTDRARSEIDAHRSPDPGPADPDVLRIAREAYERAIRASCGVQRTGDCPDPATPAGQH